jgi:peptidoglycan/LPS O-acetylase OafA/YrhL
MTTIIILLTGKGELVKRFLSQPLWRPFSRLSYGVYLIFPMVVGAGYYATNTQMFVSYAVATIRMVSNIALCYLFSFGLFLLIEKPIENFKNLAYVRIFERKTATHVKNNPEAYKMLWEEDIDDLKAHLKKGH